MKSEDLFSLIQPLTKFRVDPDEDYAVISGFCGRWGHIITKSRIKHFRVECRSWKCIECREGLFDAWKDAMCLVWPRDRLYVGYIYKPLKSVSKWMSKIGIKKAVKVLAGKDVYLVITDQSFPGGERRRKNKVFNIMKKHLFDHQIDQGQKHRISTTREFRENLRGAIKHYILVYHNMLNSTPLKSINPSKIEKKLNLHLVNLLNDNDRILARAWDNKKGWEELGMRWPQLSDVHKAKVLKELHLTEEGKRFIEETLAVGDSILLKAPDFYIENPNIYLEGQERIKEERHGRSHLAKNKSL